MVLQRPQPLGKIAKELGISAAGVTEIADKLFNNDLARRASVPGDRRKWLLQITKKGTSVLETFTVKPNDLPTT
jgi:DNA-binding MarR family transcriptional regulator